MPTIQFTYHTGLRREIFSHPRLRGSWDAHGAYSDQWAEVPMTKAIGTDGCPIFQVSVDLQAGSTYRWGVVLDTPYQHDVWGIMDEIQDIHSTDRYRSFTLDAGANDSSQDYYFSTCRRLGAQKYFRPGQDQPGIRFSVWAPNAKNVELVIGEFDRNDKTKQTGYISDNGQGIDKSFPNRGVFSMHKKDDGTWTTDPQDPYLAVFASADHNTDFDHRPYMFRITLRDGTKKYRTDLYSRCQIGKGFIDPKGQPYTGWFKDLDGCRSCSVVINPETVTKEFEEQCWPEIAFIPDTEFWANEFDPGKPLPQKGDDLIIYELVIGSLGFGQSGSDGKPRLGNFADAIQPAFLDYIVSLGVNAVELLPVMQFEGDEQWGYGTSNYFALEYSAGGRDQLKHLVREYHRHGIAVILDVVYNHYHHEAERAEWAYDSDSDTENIYYWYEGRPEDYPAFEAAAKQFKEHPTKRDNPPLPGQGGYLDNGSTGFAPRYYEEKVRQMFIGGAVQLIEEFHIDGLRLDLTSAIHSANQLHADGRSVGSANTFGAKFLRQFCRTLKLLKPTVILSAEDYSGWDKVTASPDEGGLGFDYIWYAEFYHHLMGDAERGPQDARLVKMAGMGGNGPLAIDYFAGAMQAAAMGRVVYNESHDEAGNASQTHRSIVVAANGAPLIGDTRKYAEARCRWAAAMSMLSAGLPMFLMGEEIGASKDLCYNNVLASKEDIFGLRRGYGGNLFRYYSELIGLRRARPSLRSRDISIVHIHNNNRVLAFVRRCDGQETLVVASLNNAPFSHGYTFSHPAISSKRWQEVFNSDSEHYGGDNIGNYGTMIDAVSHTFNCVVPANGVIIFE